MKKTLFALALAAAFGAMAQQTTTVEGDLTGKVDNQNIGDTNVSDVRSNSDSTQIGNSANANGANITVPTNVDTRDQNTVNVNPVTNSAGGAATGNRSDNANNSAASVGPTTATSGPVTGTNTGKVDSTNVLGQQQGIKGSGNSKATGGQGGTGGSSGASAQGGAAQGGSASTGPISNTLGASSGVERSGNSAVQVDASDRSSTQYSSRAVVWAPVVHTTAPALAAGALVVVPGACGPRVNIVRRDVVGQRFGVMGGQQEVMQGQDETTAPAANLFLVVEGFLVGHSVTTYTASVGTSSASSFSLGGFSNNGGGAQGGGSTGGQLQQLVQRVAVRECIYSSVQLAPEKNTAQAVAVPAQVLPVPARAAQTDRN